MIAFNNNIYRTINDKFYLGNKQIGKVYLGTTLIYPEQTQEQENVVEGHKLEGIRLGGNVYDTGIAPTKNTTVEICFENKQNTIGPNGFPVFGTHHDIYYAKGGNSSRYDSTGDNGNWKTKTDDKYKSHTGWYEQWRGFTNFHLIIKRKDNVDYAYVRYGGPAVQQNYIEKTGQLYTLPTNNYYPWGEAFLNEFYDSKYSDNIINCGSGYFNRTIDKKHIKDGKEYQINGKFFCLRIESTNETKKTTIYGGKLNNDGQTTSPYDWEFTYKKAKIYLGQGIGTEYYGSTGLYESSVNGKEAAAGFIYNGNEHGGNLWIGTHNRNFSITTDAVVSNKIRNNVPPNTSLSSATDFKNDCDDLDTNLFKSGDLEWVYVIIKQSDNERYLFIPEKTGVIESGNDYYIIFKRYPWDSVNGKFSTTHDKIVLPFMKCSINNN